MADDIDDIVEELLSHRGGQDDACAKELCALCRASTVILAQEDEIERLRDTGDALAASVETALHGSSLDIYATLAAWKEARRG